MKRLLVGVALTALMAQGAMAATVAVSMDKFNDNFLTVLRLGMQDYAKTLDGVTLQVEDANDDVAKQLDQIQNFIASKVDAIIVNPVDTDATQAMSDAAAAAKIPLVYVNRQPINLDKLPDNQAFVGSDERQSGTLEAKEICRLLKEKGKGSGANIYVLQGQLSNQAAQQRTADVHDVIATDDCKFMKIIGEQTGNWDRTQGGDLMTNWMSTGEKFDAVVSNNDEMAIGAIQALKAAGVARDSYFVGGVDATQDALAAMAAGDLDVTVFQDAAGQGKGALDAALALAKGEKVEQVIYIPFQQVTPANMKDFQKKNSTPTPGRAGGAPLSPD